MQDHADIPYQNYDILFKSLTETFAHKALTFYGLDTPPIVKAEKTELPRIKVEESRMDFVFLLEDDTYLHLEFQTKARVVDLERCLEYDIALFKSRKKRIRTAIIYGKDITETVTNLDHGSVQYVTQAVYMGRYDGETIYSDLQEKVTAQGRLDDLDQLNLIFLPLMKSEVSPSERAIEAVEIAKKVKDESQKVFLIGSLVAISDKFIDKEYVDRLMEVMKMTQVGELLFKKGREEGREEGNAQTKQEIAKKLIAKGVDVAFIVETTGLTEQEVEKLKEG